MSKYLTIVKKHTLSGLRFISCSKRLYKEILITVMDVWKVGYESRGRSTERNSNIS
jgi:hypothetical protein